MSATLYGAVTRQRERTDPTAFETTGTGPPALQPMSKFVDALAALVPADLLALHAAMVAIATTTTDEGDEAVTTITDPGLLRATFWVLLVLGPVLYLVGHFVPGGQAWHKLDAVRMLIPAAAFAGWTMAQKSTAFDAVADWGNTRYLIAGAAAVFLGALALRLAAGANEEAPG